MYTIDPSPIASRGTGQRKQRYFSCLVLVVAALASCQAVLAQRCTKRPEDLKFVREMKDAGADLAVVVRDQAPVYEQPSATSRVATRVKRGDFLALVKRVATGNWYRVIEVDSATEGWIDECDVIIKLSQNQESGPPLEQERIASTENCELNIANLEHGTNLNLRLNGTLYVIPAGTTKIFTLKPGKYEFYGYSRGVRPAFGNENFQAGVRYSWTFQIVTR